MEFQHTGSVALTKIITLVKTALKGKVDAVEGKGLSTNDLTNELVEKINNTSSTVDGLVSTGGQANVIEKITVNGVEEEVGDGKVVDITVPTKMSDLEDDTTFIDEAELNAKGYQNAAQVETAITAKGYQTAEQVAAAIASVDHVKRVIVESTDAIDLTAEDADQYIYMVKKSSTKAGDKYDEYMVFDGELEKVGDWAIDLSGYVQEKDITDMTAEEVQTLWDSVTV